jgi:hypothetical protein
MTTIHHLFPQKSIQLKDIQPLSYSVYISEVLALEAAARLIEEDMKIDYVEAIKVLHASRDFGNHHYDSDSPEISTHIKAAALRGIRPTPHDASVYYNWIASCSNLGIDDWMKTHQQVLSADSEELRIKQEEMDADPLAAFDFSGTGIPNDPIDLTLEDSE